MRSDKLKAIELRKAGESYNQISRDLQIPKSTLSGWFNGLSGSLEIKTHNISKAKLIWAENITRYNKKRSEQKRVVRLDAQKKFETQIRKITLRELLLIGTALYWAEGYKKNNWNLVFCNSDPVMVKFIMRFFIEVCKLPKIKLKGQVQIHHNISDIEANSYWEKISGIPKNQFLSPIYQQSKASKLIRKNSLPFGTFRIRINDVGTVNKIKGWIAGLGKNVS